MSKPAADNEPSLTAGETPSDRLEPGSAERCLCFTEQFLTAVGGYDGKCGPPVCEIRDVPQHGDVDVVPGHEPVPLPLDVEDPIRYWTRFCQRCRDQFPHPYQERAL